MQTLVLYTVESQPKTWKHFQDGRKSRLDKFETYLNRNWGPSRERLEVKVEQSLENTTMIMESTTVHITTTIKTHSLVFPEGPRHSDEPWGLSLRHPGWEQRSMSFRFSIRLEIPRI
jgi:hypothetical protein